MIHRRRMMAAALAAIAIPCIAHGQTPPPPDRPMPPPRTPTTATRVDPSLAPVARSLAMEWSALGLGLGEMATVARHPHRHRYRYR